MAPADDPIELLAGFPLFSSLPPETVAELAGRLRAVDVRCGEALIREGEPGDSLFLVVDGRFEARAAQPFGGPRILGVVGRGETIGEMAVITAGPRSASVVAIRRSRVLELSGESFLRVLERYPAELLALTRRIVQRAARPPASSPIRRVAVLPLDKGLDLAWLVEALAEALSGFGTTARLGRALALAQAGKRGIVNTVPQLSAPFLEWLAAQERTHDFVVYEAMHQLGEWTRRCLAQADLVLLVGSAGGSPEPTPLENEVLGADAGVTLAPRHLVILRPDRALRPSGTARWLDAREVALHHHVAAGDQGDVDRLARIVAGRAVEVGTRTIWTVGSVAGFLPGHTGNNRTFPDAIRAMLRVKVRHPERAFYFVSMLMNPGGYDLLVQLCPETYPSVLRPRSPDGFEPALIAATARAAGAEVIRDDPRALIVSVGRAARDGFERRRETPNTRFFEEVNPGYPDGDLLGVCAPLGVRYLVAGAARLARRRLKKRLARLRSPI